MKPLNFISAIALFSVALSCSLWTVPAAATPLDQPIFFPFEAWDPVNNPGKFSTDFELNLLAMPDAGSLTPERIPWSDSYWPSRKGGISHRWNSPKPMDFRYRPPTRSLALQMTQEQLAALSPAEKYDLFLGNYNYPTVYSIRRSTSPRDPAWYGLCHGWSQASIFYGEPAPVTMVNPDGIPVPFGSSDVKALLTYYYANHGLANSVQIGRRSWWGGGFFNPRARRDVNAGTFHVVLVNMVALRNLPFIADTNGGYQVWNAPVFAFTTRALKTSGPRKDSSALTVRRILMETTIQTGSSKAAPSWEPTRYTEAFKTVTRTYKYWLELDSANRIIGGQWTTSTHPDFLWISKKIEFEGYFSGIRDIYQPAP